MKLNKKLKRRINMKITVEREIRKLEPIYPILLICTVPGVNHNMIVLFTYDFKGLVLTETPDYPLGSIIDNWDMGSFVEFKGKVIIENNND
jgi:hypothetical protein